MTMLESAVGIALCTQLKDLTVLLQEALPKDVQLIHDVAQQLTEALSYVFPAGRVARFAPTDRRLAGVAHSAIKVPKWRRAVRRVVEW